MIMTIMTLFYLLVSSNEAFSYPSIEGRWHFTSYLYNGTELPKPNPNLTILFEFDNGVSRLYWSRKDEVGFCERKARYQYSQEHISEIIVWVNPDNRFDCGRDPDMQLGRQSKTNYRFHNGNLQTRVLVGDLDVWYIWTLQE